MKWNLQLAIRHHR